MFNYLDYVNALSSVLQKVDSSSIEIATQLVGSYLDKPDRCIYVIGNGGSAHIASHLVTDWKKMAFVLKGEKEE